MNARNEWKALGKLVGLALQMACAVAVLFGFIALMEMAGL
jgi:hypothetical protein